MSNGNDLKRICVQFTYPKCMIMYSMEEEMRRKRKTRKEDEKRKKRFHFFDHQVRTGHGF